MCKSPKRKRPESALSKPATGCKWVPILGELVRHIWQCDECKRMCEVGPGFYEEAGTPLCGDCDCDMAHLRTEVHIKKTVNLGEII